MRDAVKTYLTLANGLTDVTKQRAKAAAKALVEQGEAKRSQVSALADDLMKASKDNRAMLTALVRGEVEKAVGKVAAATTDEVGKLSQRIASLEGLVRGGGSARGRSDDGPAAPSAASPAAAGERTAAAAAPKTAPAKKAAAKKAPAKKAPAKPASTPADTKAPRSKASPARAVPAKKPVRKPSAS